MSQERIESMTFKPFAMFLVGLLAFGADGSVQAQALGGICSLENDTGYAYSAVTPVGVTIDCAEATTESNLLSGSIHFSDSYVDVPMDTSKVMSVSALGCGFSGVGINNLYTGACKNPVNGAWLCTGGSRVLGLSESTGCIPVSTMPQVISGGSMFGASLSIDSLTGVEVLSDRLRFVCGQGRWTSSTTTYSWTTMRATVLLKQ
jgi:hypothetical protein